eukprot:15479604-Alexandrium_andersonii.AAC.1
MPGCAESGVRGCRRSRVPLARAVWPPRRVRQARAAHAEPRCRPDDGHGGPRNDPMAKPSLLEAFVRGPPRPSPGERGSARAASAWRTCCGS